MDNSKELTHVGLCAGYGGIELGLKRVIPSLRTVALCEIEAFACANLVAKMEAGFMDPAPIWTDLKTFPWEEFCDRVDVLTGGYPCQPFSAAGQRKGADDPRHLWPFISAGIAAMRPRLCFFENVEGHISLGLPDVIEDLGRLGYRATWGIFSAAEVGAPHQRKRVFIMAHRNSERGQLSNWWKQSTEQVFIGYGAAWRDVWPSRPGEPQHAWEPPRVVGNADLQHDSRTIRTNELSSGQGGLWACGESSIEADGQYWKTQPALGLCADESSSVLGETLTLNPCGDNVDAYVSEKARARQILFEVWNKINSQEVQWTPGGLQYFLTEEILRSGMQLAAFTQRICYFVWCVQTGHPIQGWGLSGMWVYESCRNPSQGQEPIEQFKRELGYAMCQLSYEIALERGQETVEGAAILQGLRESSEGAWALSDALPEMEEVWRSTLDQKVWENGCYVEAASQGNRTDELRLLGNGVVPATAALAFQTLARELFL